MKSSVLIFSLSAVVVLGLIGFAVWKGARPSLYDGFADCLSEKGVTMYGAWWCPHCKAQKEAFQGAFDRVNYVECSNADKSMNQTCIDAGVSGYPTWKFADGSTLSGEQTLQTLSEKTTCELPQP